MRVFSLLCDILLSWSLSFSIALAVPCQWRFPGAEKFPFGLVGSEFNDIAFGGGVYIIAGEGFLLRSEDAKNWQRIPFAKDTEFISVVAGNGQFVVGGDVILHSEDGLHWADCGADELRRSLTPCRPNKGWIASLAWNGERYVGLGPSAILHSDDGVTWTSVPYPAAGPVRVQWVDGLFVGLHRFGVIQSIDGEHWSHNPVESAAINAEQYTGIASDGNVQVIVTRFGSIYTRSNGTAWTGFSSTERFSSTKSQYLGLSDVAWNGQRFVAVGFEGLMLVSEDGLQWRMQVQPMKEVFYHNRHVFVAIRWLNGRFMTVDSFGGLHTSVDGLTWASSRPTGIACPLCPVLSCDDS